MIVTRVVRAEGVASALRRTQERLAEALDDVAMRVARPGDESAEVLNVSVRAIAPRFGGVQVQLRARLRHERSMRNVALLHPGGLDAGGHRRRLDGTFISRVRRALEITGARMIHLENTEGAPLDDLLHAGVPVVASVHDFSLFCTHPHLIEQVSQQFCDYSRDAVRCGNCFGVQEQRRAMSRTFLERAAAVIFPSRFLLERHRALFDLPLEHARVIEPGVSAVAPRANPGNAIAFIGAVKTHKGAHLLPELIRGDAGWHIFGGGDEALLRPLRNVATVHGYYRDGDLPALLAKHRIGLTVIPSIWPETHSLVLTESWLAGVPSVAFDLGAIGERIRAHGGGWLVPLDRGAAGLATLIDRWRAGALTAAIPKDVPDARDAAEAHVALYRSL
jgi:glycosyltransferase involved in cell wall biosynthesis